MGEKGETDDSSDDEELESKESVSFKNEGECKGNLTFNKNIKYNNVLTDIPYALDQQQLDDMIKVGGANQNSQLGDKNIFKGTPIEEGLKRFNNSSLDSKKLTLKYLFEKIRSGYYIKLKDGSLVEFVPFYNIHFDQLCEIISYQPNDSLIMIRI